MFTTKWQPVEKGIETGFTISPILFVMGDEPDHLCSDYKVKRTKGPAAGSQQPAIMDGLTVTTPTHVQARWVLVELDGMAMWARMILKPKKSRCLVIQKDKTTERFRLFV